MNNDVPAHSDLNKMDEQIAQAADGSIWTDIAIVRSWFPLDTYGGAGTDVIGEALLWEPTVGQWWSFGTKATSVSSGYRSYTGLNWLTTSMDSDAPDANVAAVKCAATDGAGTIVVGIGPTGATDLKIRTSVDAGTTWSSEALSASASSNVNLLCWGPSAGLFVAGLSNAATTNLETSPDGVTWTQRTAPNAHARQAAAASPSVIVVLASTSTDKCITSGDGITWAERTLPSSTTWRTIAYNAVLNKFLALSDGGAVAQSVDGITWTAMGLTAPPSPSSDMKLFAMGRLWVLASGNNVVISADSGATWKVVENFSMVSGFQMAAAPAQLLFAQGGAGNTTRRTLQGGL